MMARGTFRAFPGLHAARLGAMRPDPGIRSVPWPGAAVDINFLLRTYYWGGAAKTEANFTTFNLNGSTFDANGLTPSPTIDVTLSLAGLGTFVPGSWGASFYTLGAPVTFGTFFQLDNGTSVERVAVTHAVNGRINPQIVTASTSQAFHAGFTEATGVRHGTAHSYATNSVMFAANDLVAIAEDTAAIMPTVTILRIGRALVGVEAKATICRLVFFTAPQPNQATVNALSIDMRDRSG